MDAPVDQLYHPSKLNCERYKNATKSLYQKLKNNKLLEAFHEQFTKSLKEGHMEILTPKQAEEVLKLAHCVIRVNYQMKPSSVSHEQRMVTNSSSVHQSGSLNSHCPKGLNLIG